MPDDDEVVQRVLRLDLGTGELGTRRTTPQGGLVARARIARTGVLVYQNQDGTTRRELRLEEDVFKKESLDSFRAAPITMRHPGALITPLNWRDHVIGHMAGDVEKEDSFVAGDAHVQDAKGVRAVESGDVELSCGYQCRLDKTPGEHPVFGKYDAIQRDIVGNHIAIGPSGWGRSGPDVSLHLDGETDDTLAVSGFEAGSYVRDMPKEAATQTPSTTQTPIAPATPPATNTDAGDATLRGENAALKAENERLTREATSRNDAATQEANQKRFDARVTARVALIASAKPILGAEWRDDGKSDDAVRREVLAELEPDLELPEAKADGAEGFVMGAFAHAVKRADRAAVGNRNAVLASPRGGRADASTPRRVPTKRTDDAGGDTQAAEMTIGERTDAKLEEQKDRWKKKSDRGGRR